MEKRPLVICTDPGIDDFIALSMVLSRPEFDVLGMVALSGNVGLDVTVNNALLACEYNARADIPVLAGSAKPLVRPVRSASNIHGKSGLGASLELYAKGTPSDKNGADFIIEMARKYAGKLEILSLGPLTDVALVLEKAPEIAKAIACITIMGGGVHAGNATRYAEFNIVADPEAASVVFAIINSSQISAEPERFAGRQPAGFDTSRVRTLSFCARRPSLAELSPRCCQATRTFTSRSITSTA